MSEPRTFTVSENEANQRLDRFLRKLLQDTSLNAIYKLVRTRRVTVNHRKSKPDARLKLGDVIVFHQADAERRMQPALRRRAEKGLSTRRDFEVVYEDAHLVAVNKPHGLLVHAGDRGVERDTLIDQVTAWLLEKGHEAEPGDLQDFVRPSPTFSPSLAHRLDRDTSGLVLIGKTLPALQALTSMIKKREVRKTYLALAIGGLPQREGTIQASIERQEDAKGRRRKVAVGQGRSARTDYRVIAQRGQYTLAELELITGRTHQIRAHLAHVGAPIAGDDEYGDRERNRHAADKLGLKRQFLHAARLQFTHPLTGQELDLVAPLQADLARALAAAGFEPAALPQWLTAAAARKAAS